MSGWQVARNPGYDEQRAMMTVKRERTEPVTTCFEPELQVPAMEVTLWAEEKSV